MTTADRIAMNFPGANGFHSASGFNPEYDEFLGMGKKAKAKKLARKEKRLEKKTARGKDTTKIQARIDKLKQKLATIGTGGMTKDEQEELNSLQSEVNTGTDTTDTGTGTEKSATDDTIAGMPKMAVYVGGTVVGLIIIGVILKVAGVFKKKAKKE